MEREIGNLQCVSEIKSYSRRETSYGRSNVHEQLFTKIHEGVRVQKQSNEK